MNWLAWLLAMSMTMSYSDRTAKLQPNPFDYEYSYSIHKPKAYHLEIDNERENGRDYTDKEVWIENTLLNCIYLNEKFVSKETRDIAYNQFDCRYQYKSFTAGYTLRHNDFGVPGHNISFGLSNVDFHFNIGALGVQVISKSDFMYDVRAKENAVSSYNKVSLGVLTNVSVSFLYRYEFIKGKLPFEQRKIGITYTIPVKTKKGT